MSLSRVTTWLNPALFGLTVLALPTGLLLAWLQHESAARLVWNASALLLAALLVIEIAIRLFRREAGVDLLALLAIAGAVALGESLVAAVIALMLAGGRALESYTVRRAERELRRLIDRAPRFASRFHGERLEQVPVDLIEPGDRLLVRMGEVLPVDGRLLAMVATLDESALSGESLPVRRNHGETLRSGSVNAAAPFELEATHTVAQSTYASIVRMVESARGSRTPFMRIADRYALALIPLTLFMAAGAWLISADPLRALAVLVVATPCPLILAVPVAIISGISRCTQRSILIKDGATLEALARPGILFLDKTGTLTTGRVSVQQVDSSGQFTPTQILQLAASVAQVSPHVVSAAIAEHARRLGLELDTPAEVHEEPGSGLRGVVGGHTVVLGGYQFVSAAAPDLEWTRSLLRRIRLEDTNASFIAIDGNMAGAVLFADPLRLESPRALRRLRQAGIRRVVMLTGDRVEAAQAIGLAAGVDEVRAELTPADKLAAIAAAREHEHTLMVGDGINDAPALAAADVGIAMGAGGATASSEAASVVLLVNRLDRVAEAMQIARRTRRIALQGVWAGMGMAVLAMLLAALGYLPPLAGAVVQEVIDVAVILNALRALAGGSDFYSAVRLDAGQVDLLRNEHAALGPLLQRVHGVAEGMAGLPWATARKELDDLVAMLENDLVPHEQADEATLYPQLADHLQGDDPLAAMSHTHREIFRLVRQLARMNLDLAGRADEPPMIDIQHILLRLDALLHLHFAQEEELYHNLDDR